MISVCIATYNGEKYIKEQIDSILKQLGCEDEIIISDDDSTDSTLEIIENYNDRRIILVKNKNIKSPIFNFENALKQARGDYIFLSDQDDVWLPEKISICLLFLENYDVVLTDCMIVNETLHILKNSLFEINKSKSGLIQNLIRNSYSGGCMVLKKEVLKIALPFPKTIPMHDIWLGYVTELFFKPVFIQDKLLMHRIHNTNATFTGDKSKYSIFKRVQFRWNIIKYTPLIVFRRYFK